MAYHDDFERILDELACELPQEFYHELSGGIIISDSAKEHEQSRSGDLYVLGEYQHGLAGRCIVIYYGSFRRVFGQLPEEALRAELRKTLRHEFRHHLESLAGERGLEREDDVRLRRYLDSYER